MTRLIDADTLKDQIKKAAEQSTRGDEYNRGLLEAQRLTINAPTIAAAVEWIEMKTRPATPEEIETYREMIGEEIDTVFDCSLPDDGQVCFISTTWGGVYIDQFDRDVNSFVDHDDPDEVVAWAKLPEPYKKHS